MAKDIEAAVRAAQVYGGALDSAPIRVQQKLYEAMKRKIASVASRRGMDYNDAFRQITDAATARGLIRPSPGKDY